MGEVERRFLHGRNQRGTEMGADLFRFGRSREYIHPHASGLLGRTRSVRAYWVIPFYTANLAAFTEAFTGFMGTETGRSFPGRVAIHQCSYCGEQEANAMFSVQHSTPEAFDDWRETSASSKDFQEWVQTAFAMAKFTGSNLIAALDLYPVNSTALLQ